MLIIGPHRSESLIYLICVLGVFSFSFSFIFIHKRIRLKLRVEQKYECITYFCSTLYLYIDNLFALYFYQNIYYFLLFISFYHQVPGRLLHLPNPYHTCLVRIVLVMMSICHIVLMAQKFHAYVTVNVYKDSI